MIHKAFEHKSQRLLPAAEFVIRLAVHSLLAWMIVMLALGAGMLGYHYLESLDWTDAFLNAAMILGGMGPVTELKTEGGKFFAGCYALFSGLIFLVAAGLIVGPLLHRLLHRFHLDLDKQ